MDHSAVNSVPFTSLDGFFTALALDEALHILIVFEEDGEPLSARDAGGTAPFRLVLAQDRFPQRWLRNVAEITLVGEAPDGTFQRAT